ncbi:MAG: TonB-dependent receptor, partial [Bacteroidota bacterium]
MNKLIQTTKKIGQLIIMIFLSFSVSGQSNNCIHGQIVNGLNKEPIPFASVVLFHTSDSSQVKGTMSEINGEFRFCNIQKGKYLVEISHVGFNTNQQTFHFTGNSTYNAGIIQLIEKTTGIEKVVILGERVKAKDEGDKTTYFINKKIQKASNTGVDVLKLMPGVQLDLMQNLSLEGGQNIIIMVNGRERDLNFIRQLSGEKIDKIEINTSPGAEYSSDVNGVINVVLKNKKRGISGQINAEIPTSPSEVYLFPNYSIQYGIQKFNFFTSYTGELIYFDITDRNHRSFLENNGNHSIRKVQHVRQKNWSHRFNLGMDYQINEKNQINLYGYYNPFSQEHDGKTLLETQGSAISNIYWLADKEDTDKNRVAFYSIYYNHLFAEEHKFTVDLSYYNFQAENTTQYAIDSATGIDNKDIVSTRKPRINTALIKMDYTIPIKENWRINVGLKNTYKLYQDIDSELFNQHENIFAFYGNTSCSGSLFHLKAGLRYEQSVTKLKQQFNQTNSLFLPSVKLNYKISEKKNLTLSYRSGVYRPNVYQLNPSVVYDDPFSMENGNPGLNNESRHYVYLDYSIRPGSNFVSSRIFFQKTMQTINKLTVINGDNMFETHQHNLG